VLPLSIFFFLLLQRTIGITFWTAYVCITLFRCLVRRRISMETVERVRLSGTRKNGYSATGLEIGKKIVWPIVAEGKETTFQTNSTKRILIIYDRTLKPSIKVGTDRYHVMWAHVPSRWQIETEHATVINFCRVFFCVIYPVSRYSIGYHCVCFIRTVVGLSTI